MRRRLMPRIRGNRVIVFWSYLLYPYSNAIDRFAWERIRLTTVLRSIRHDPTSTSIGIHWYHQYPYIQILDQYTLNCPGYVSDCPCIWMALDNCTIWMNRLNIMHTYLDCIVQISGKYLLENFSNSLYSAKWDCYLCRQKRSTKIPRKRRRTSLRATQK